MLWKTEMVIVTCTAREIMFIEIENTHVLPPAGRSISAVRTRTHILIILYDDEKFEGVFNKYLNYIY
jgi:hypothetical protein